MMTELPITCLRAMTAISVPEEFEPDEVEQAWQHAIKNCGHCAEWARTNDVAWIQEEAHTRLQAAALAAVFATSRRAS